jgi:hypothetical protein
MQNKLSSQFTHGRSPSNPTKEKEGAELPAVGEMFTVDKAQEHDDSTFILYQAKESCTTSLCH